MFYIVLIQLQDALTFSHRKINKNNIRSTYMQHAQPSTIRIYCRHALHSSIATSNCWFAWLLIIIFVNVLVLLFKTMLSTCVLTNVAHYLFPKMQFVIKLFTLHTSINLYGLFIVVTTVCVRTVLPMFIYRCRKSEREKKTVDHVGKIEKNNEDEKEEGKNKDNKELRDGILVKRWLSENCPRNVLYMLSQINCVAVTRTCYYECQRNRCVCMPNSGCEWWREERKQSKKVCGSYWLWCRAIKYLQQKFSLKPNKWIKRIIHEWDIMWLINKETMKRILIAVHAIFWSISNHMELYY